MWYVWLNRRSDVVALVLDASECADTDSERFVITQQDFRCDSRPHAQQTNSHFWHLCRIESGGTSACESVDDSECLPYLHAPLRIISPSASPGIAAHKAGLSLHESPRW